MMGKNINILLLYIFFGLITTIYIFGFDYISFANSSWLSTRDMTADLVSWQYFKNDIWRFPIGNNPNFGLDTGSSIAFTAVIPFFALIFKALKYIIPGNFHYFGFWIFLCLGEINPIVLRSYRV